MSFSGRVPSSADLRAANQIAELIAPWLSGAQQVLEIAAGNGALAVAICQRLPQLTWHATELPERLAPLQMTLRAHALGNAATAQALDVRLARWPTERGGVSIDAVVTANTCHVMDWPAVKMMFDGIGRILASSGQLILLGPFRDDGVPPHPELVALDRQLKSNDRKLGVRSWQSVDVLARRARLQLTDNLSLNSGKHLLRWQVG